MKASFYCALALSYLCGAFALQSQEMPELQPPPVEAAWLQKFVGEWESESTLHMEDGAPPAKGKGSESVSSLGGFWIVAQGKGEMMGVNMGYLLTIGYDAEKKKYVASWVDSLSSYRWNYEGTLDESSNTFTLEAEGPCPMRPGELTRFKDVTEFIDNDTRKFTSMMFNEGEWVTMVTGTAKRKK